MRSLRQIKDLISNMAKEKGINAQILLRNYMMERLLERIALSEYKDNFILKGGMLVSALVGVESRATVDMDTTIKRKVVNLESVTKVFNEIVAMEVDDGIVLTLKSISEIKADAEYSGFRVSIEAKLESAKIPLKVDITSGDAITPKEVVHQYKLLLEDRTIDILSYNIETVLAEKIETIISRSVANTRMRDFYDIHILLQLKMEIVNIEILKEAMKATAIARGTWRLFDMGEEILQEIQVDSIMEEHWKRYQNKYSYAYKISWNDVCGSMKKLWDLIC